jgi:hypothetical protein
MEKWLTLLLEWDAAKRGRAINKNKELEIVVFDMIEGILSKKVCDFILYGNDCHFQNLNLFSNVWPCL